MLKINLLIFSPNTCLEFYLFIMLDKNQKQLIIKYGDIVTLNMIL